MLPCKCQLVRGVTLAHALRHVGTSREKAVAVKAIIAEGAIFVSGGAQVMMPNPLLLLVRKRTCRSVRLGTRTDVAFHASMPGGKVVAETERNVRIATLASGSAFAVTLKLVPRGRNHPRNPRL